MKNYDTIIKKDIPEENSIFSNIEKLESPKLDEEVEICLKFMDCWIKQSP
jgi:hypothetical protein